MKCPDCKDTGFANGWVDGQGDACLSCQFVCLDCRAWYPKGSAHVCKPIRPMRNGEADVEG